MSSNIKRSVSLYSYQEEYYTGKMNLEDCIREAARAGATGIELLPEQMMDCFPLVTDEFKEKWFGWMEKYGTEPSCSDAFLENHIYDNRMLTLKEQIAMMDRDIRIASELGFKTLRTLVSTPLDVIEGSLPCAEENNVKICLEVHSPFSLNSGWADGYLEMIRRTGTKVFGFMPDFGIFCKHVPDLLISQARENGAKEECIQAVIDAFEERVAGGIVKIKYDLNLGRAHGEYMKANHFPELMARIERLGGGALEKSLAGASFNYTWTDPQDVVDNIQYIYHTHAKFYHMTEDYKDTAVQIDDAVAAYKRAGYTGFLSSEYEGNNMINDDSLLDSVEQVRRHQEALRRAIEE